jgi:hypothetical protein
MDAAAERLRLSALPFIGIFTATTSLPINVSIPRASFPKIATQSPTFLSSNSEVAPCAERANFVISGNFSERVERVTPE